MFIKTGPLGIDSVVKQAKIVSLCLSLGFISLKSKFIYEQLKAVEGWKLNWHTFDYSEKLVFKYIPIFNEKMSLFFEQISLCWDMFVFNDETQLHIQQKV